MAAEPMGENKAQRLNRLQRWMMEVVSHPDGVEEGAASDGALCLLPEGANQLGDVVAPSTEMSAEDRIRVYANMYFWRQVDVLTEDFSHVRHLLGSDLFYDTAVDYLVAHPSQHYSLSVLGRRFPVFLRDEAADIPHREFVHEVAVLEDTIEEIFDAPRDKELLTIDDLVAIPQDAWGGARFRFIQALRLHRFQYPVNSYFNARREDRQMDVPEKEAAWLVVFRKDFTVWRLAVDEIRFTLLNALADGVSLGEALELCVERPEVEPDEFLANLQAWFQDWTGEGFFAGVDIS